MQRPLLHLNWLLEQEWLQPASSLLSPQSLSGERKEQAGGQQVPSQEGAGRRDNSRDLSLGEVGNNRDRTVHTSRGDVG